MKTIEIIPELLQEGDVLVNKRDRLERREFIYLNSVAGVVRLRVIRSDVLHTGLYIGMTQESLQERFELLLEE